MITSYNPLVKPGVEETPHAFDLFNELITELLPTLGYPMTPTVTEVLIPSFFE